MTDKARRKRPSDANQLGKLIVDISTGDIGDHELEQKKEGKDPAAVSLGRRGGLKGGAARAKALSPSERRQIAQRAAQARWKKDDG